MKGQAVGGYIGCLGCGVWPLMLLAYWVCLPYRILWPESVHFKQTSLSIDSQLILNGDRGFLSVNRPYARISMAPTGWLPGVFRVQKSRAWNSPCSKSYLVRLCSAENMKLTRNFMSWKSSSGRYSHQQHVYWVYPRT